MCPTPPCRAGAAHGRSHPPGCSRPCSERQTGPAQAGQWQSVSAEQYKRLQSRDSAKRDVSNKSHAMLILAVRSGLLWEKTAAWQCGTDATLIDWECDHEHRPLPGIFTEVPCTALQLQHTWVRAKAISTAPGWSNSASCMCFSASRWYSAAALPAAACRPAAGANQSTAFRLRLAAAPFPRHQPLPQQGHTPSQGAIEPNLLFLAWCCAIH